MFVNPQYPKMMNLELIYFKERDNDRNNYGQPVRSEDHARGRRRTF